MSVPTKAPDPAAVARFGAAFSAVAPGGTIALAVSGGADSMAMLVLAHVALPGRTIAATVDHRLRAEAAGEAAMVANHCAALAIPHTILTPDVPIAGASIQAQARAARYRLLRDWAGQAGAVALLTAHHADDQAETLLMRAARGSGVSGLAGIRRVRDLEGIALIRPLLDWRRAELRAVAEAAGAPFVDDPSNRDEAHDRTRFRRMVEANPELDVAGIAASASYAAEAEQALEALADAEWDQRIVTGATLTLAAAQLPRDLRRRLARRAIGEVRALAAIAVPFWSDAANVEALLDALAAGKSATQAGVMVSPRGKTWRFSAAPPRRSH